MATLLPDPTTGRSAIPLRDATPPAPAPQDPNRAGQNRRVLIIDDNRAIHDDFKKILSTPTIETDELAIEAAFFGEAISSEATPAYEIDSAYQGEEGLHRVREAVASGRPYALAFVDVRMPPGWDGLETVTRIWECYPDLQIVLCTAYSDYSWEEMIARVGQSDRLLILKKPFENVEVLQLANALTEKWRLLQQSRIKVAGLEQTVVELKENEERSRRALAHELGLNQIKSGFVTMVSHEFRTPLGVVKTAAHLLDRYLDRMTVEESGAKVHEIQSAVDRMVQMMEDFLVHGELQAGKLECKPAPLEVAALCRMCIAEAANPASGPRAIECCIALDANEACLDGKILRHILGNLLSNAVKYSDPERPVTLDVQRIAGDPAASLGAHLQFTVTDSGIGIPTPDLAKLFQTFHRAANVGQRPGTGMGLAIVKQCVDVHRGTIQVESREGGGTSFCVCLPLFSPRSANCPPAPPTFPKSTL